MQRMTDINKLLQTAKEGGDDALEAIFAAYKNMVRARARAYFIAGGDVDDLIQEGMIGLYKAIRDYDEMKNISFAAFASVCIERQILTAVKTQTRKKHSPLNASISLDFTENTVIENNPESIFLDKERKLFIETEIARVLSGLEKSAMVMYLNGDSYIEIAAALGIGKKAVGNALQRARKKINEAL